MLTCPARYLFLCCAGLTFLSNAPTVATAQEKRWVVIFVGLAGDADYEKKYASVADVWEQWFQTELSVPAEQIIRPKSPLTAETMQKSLAELATKLQPTDSLWLLTLGHGDHDGKHARFHVAGRDPTEEDWPRWLADIKCREQVLWLTHSSSGWLVKPLSKPGRVIIAATEAAEEVNETEFPYAFTKVLQGPAKDCDANADGKVSLAELFPRVVAATNERFTADKRVPTEHAQLDDDGDGRSSEELSGKDGALAKTIFIPWLVK